MLKVFKNGYFEELKETLEEISLEKVQKVVEIIYEAYREGKQVFIMGNGGSAATASHFACDLSKGTIVEGKERFKVISLNDNMSLITALSNDFGYERVFIEQLMNLISEKDVVIGITASGNSENILQAVDYARTKGAITLGFIGFGGGKLKEMVDEHITVSSMSYEQVENIHLILSHAIAKYFRERFERESLDGN
jgi:D-sedoheptulose 7-phosphate isomerase